MKQQQGTIRYNAAINPKIIPGKLAKANGKSLFFLKNP